jgi:5-methylcytosine-specific restriction endonuclease McrA
MRSPGTCALCDREAALTFHHLIPKTLRTRKRYRRDVPADKWDDGIHVCRACHDAIHRFLDEEALAEQYATVEALREHPGLAAFVKWVRRQDPGRVVKVR